MEEDIDKLKVTIEKLLTRVEDLENVQLDVPAKLIALRPSNTLEDVKGRVNQIIAILNKLSIN